MLTCATAGDNPPSSAKSAQVPPEGIEPSTYGLRVRNTDAVSVDATTGYDDGQKNVADCVAFSAGDNPDLASIVRAWPDLPAVVKAGIIAMVKAARDSNP